MHPTPYVPEQTRAVLCQMTATAWINVDREMSDIKTILGNKMSGCGSDALGFALHVNEWNMKDGQLWLEWGDGNSGCNKVCMHLLVLYVVN